MDLTEVPEQFTWPGANQRLTYGMVAMEPVKILTGFSDQEFEIFTYHWVHFYLKPKYKKVQMRTGAGDKGRDVVAWKDPAGRSPRRWDLFQCKHYDDKLSPSVFMLELGKLCYYTFNGDYSVPDHYYLVSPQGLGPSLQDLFDSPTKLKEKLVEEWDDKCASRITKGKTVKLEGALRQHIEQFDFSIIEGVEPLELIEQHQTTPYHDIVFGTRLRKRPKPPEPPKDIQPEETQYVRKLYRVYSTKVGTTIRSYIQLKENATLSRHFDYARKTFHKATALKEFARDISPEESFEELTDVIHDGIQSTLMMSHSDSFEKVLKVCEQASNIEIDNNALKPDLVAGDKVGICHYLANEDRLDWIQED